jgi:hypothetical protein
MATRAESAASPNEEVIRRLLLPCVLASREDPLLDPPSLPLLVRGYGAASIVCCRTGASSTSFTRSASAAIYISTFLGKLLG